MWQLRGRAPLQPPLLRRHSEASTATHPLEHSVNPVHPILRGLAACLLTAATLGTTSPAWAENHALILWIGDYGDPKSDLPGKIGRAHV